MKSELQKLIRIPYRWCFNIYLNENRSQQIGQTRYIQVETREHAFEIARRFGWINEVVSSKPPNELYFELTPEFEE